MAVLLLLRGSSGVDDKIDPIDFICGNGGLFMVLRARWILGGVVAADRTEEDEDEAVLLPGPQTLILALPDAEDGDEMAEIGAFTPLPVKVLLEVAGSPSSSICFPFIGVNNCSWLE